MSSMKLPYDPAVTAWKAKRVVVWPAGTVNAGVLLPGRVARRDVGPALGERAVRGADHHAHRVHAGAAAVLEVPAHRGARAR